MSAKEFTMLYETLNYSESDQRYLISGNLEHGKLDEGP